MQQFVAPSSAWVKLGTLTLLHPSKFSNKKLQEYEEIPWHNFIAINSEVINMHKAFGADIF